MSETKKQSPLDKLKSMSMDNLDQHRTSEPHFSFLSNDGESQPVALELIDPNPWQPRRQFDNRLIVHKDTVNNNFPAEDLRGFKIS